MVIRKTKHSGLGLEQSLANNDIKKTVIGLQNRVSTLFLNMLLRPTDLTFPMAKLILTLLFVIQ